MTSVYSYLLGRGRSFFHAGSGLLRLVREEKNAQVHLMATLAVLAAAAWWRLAALEWALLVLGVMMVWAAEAANTALERLADVVSKERHPLVGAAKDLAAAAVLVTALGAVVVGCLVFFPHVMP